MISCRAKGRNKQAGAHEVNGKSKLHVREINRLLIDFIGSKANKGNTKIRPICPQVKGPFSGGPAPIKVFERQRSVDAIVPAGPHAAIVSLDVKVR